MGSVPDFIENHRAGKLRVVAVMGDKRQAAMRDVPTFAELGLKGFEDVPYYGFFAPAGAPKAAIDQLSAALAKVLAQPDVRDKLAGWGWPYSSCRANSSPRASARTGRRGRRSSAGAGFGRSELAGAIRLPRIRWARMVPAWSSSS